MTQDRSPEDGPTQDENNFCEPTLPSKPVFYQTVFFIISYPELILLLYVTPELIKYVTPLASTWSSPGE